MEEIIHIYYNNITFLWQQSMKTDKLQIYP